MRVLQPIQGDISFHHVTGQISKVKIDIAGVGIKRVRVSTLSPKVTETQIKNVMSSYGDIKKYMRGSVLTHTDSKRSQVFELLI